VTVLPVPPEETYRCGIMDVDAIQSYWETNLALLPEPSPLDLGDQS
jgi:ADP-glucose pyrophosphorylase